MKRNIFYKLLAGVLMTTILLVNSCTGILDEQPRSAITSDLLTTKQGVELALVGVYSKLRGYFGPLGYYAEVQFATDEVGIGDGGQFTTMDNGDFNASYSGDNASNRWWDGDAFSTINACNAIVQIGAEKGIEARMLAEARTIRALLYYNLIEIGGGAPLVLGDPDTNEPFAFNTEPYRKLKRNTVPECYNAIIADLNQAITDLGSSTRNDRFRGVVTKTFAQYLLSKIQLTYAWWIENNPTQAPSGITAASLYQAAYTTAMAAITDSGSGFGLLDDYRQVNLASNDRNKEVLFYADRDYNIPYGAMNGCQQAVDGGYFATSGYQENSAFLCIRPNFDAPIIVGGTQPVDRGNTQETGRPWYRGTPTQEVLFNIFNNKEYDARYFGTFQVVWKYTGYPNGAGSKNGLNGAEFVVGDTVWYMPPVTAAQFTAQFPGAVTALGYANESGSTANDGKANIPCYKLPGKKYLILPLDYTNRRYYPSLWKFGPYNPTLATPVTYKNMSSVRPYNIAKFSELYLIAAEAAVKGATGAMSATQLLNVLRTRAAFSDDKTAAEVTNSINALVALTPASPSIDDILDERMRELYGEGIRWFDLTRTKSLGRAATYTIRENAPGTVAGKDFNPIVTKTRNNFVSIAPNSKYYLRPISKTFLDALDMTDAEKAALQNPGY